MKPHSIQLLIATGLVTLGCTLIVVAMMLPPMGEIHTSVLLAYGEISTFAGALFGIDYKYRR